MTMQTSEIIKLFKWSRSAAIGLICLSVSSYCAAENLWGLLGKDFTGTVIDSQTKQPIEGAYVLAMYSIVRSGPAATTTWCVKSKGMVTGKDGKYRFPIAGLNGLPPKVRAIKPDYFFVGGGGIPRAWHEDSWSEAAYQGWDIHLAKRATEDASLSMNADSYCGHAATKEDAEASAQFLKLKLAEYIKYWPAGKSFHADLQAQISELEALPSKQK